MMGILFDERKKEGNEQNLGVDKGYKTDIVVVLEIVPLALGDDDESRKEKGV